ncbi:DUF4232 domain-containing protein [Streptomyces echinoruber]|nr:DUF4232 domain-containing protein [Streptomyces echinoruber]
MRFRTTTALRTVTAVCAAPAAAAALLLSAPQSRAVAAPGPCPAGVLALRAAAAPADASVVRVRVTNRGVRACTVDRVPTVTFGDLDGAALPVPAGGSGPYRLGPGRTAYATVRTVADPADPQVRRVDALTVSADSADPGRTFTAARLGAGDVIRVWEPVTTWWHRTQAAADRALGLQPSTTSGL